MPEMACDNWAADSLPDGRPIDLDDTELEFVAGPLPGEVPAPYYAELVKQEGKRRLVYRTYFHDFEQLGLHPRSRSRVDGLLRQRGNLFIDPRGGQPLCSPLRGVVQSYPEDDSHRCVVLDRGFQAAPRSNDPFARLKRIITESA